MLPSKNRLPRQDIALLMRFGKRIHGDFIELVFKADPRVREDDKKSFEDDKDGLTKEPRFAFMVSTKVSKKATARNRIRRILSESVRLILKNADPRVREDDKNVLGMTIDGIFVARKNIAEMSQVDVEPVVRGLLEKAGIFF